MATAKEQVSIDQVVSARLETVGTKIDNLSDTMKQFSADMRKINEDHEERLRKQAETDSRQAAEISALRESVAELKTIVDLLRKSQEEHRDMHRQETEKRLSFMQQLLMTFIQQSTPMVTMGGVVVAALKIGGFI